MLVNSYSGFSTIEYFVASFDIGDLILSGFCFGITTPFRFKHLQKIFQNFNKIDAFIPPLSTEIVQKRSKLLNVFILMFMFIVYVFDLFIWGYDTWFEFVIIFSSYGHLVVCPYEVFLLLSNKDASFLNYAQLIWVFVHICRLLVIVENCHNCKE
ncbi:hypothetical protein BDFB_011014, partial [Asbolus verrucosus]